MFAQLRAAILIFVALSALTGAVYPAVVTAIAQLACPHQANGSIIRVGGKAVGSELIGQSFDDPRFFWGRPSAITPPYDAGSSSGSNLGPTNPDLLKAVAQRVKFLRQAHPEQKGPVPVDLVTTSASGLDPHISPAAAEYQVSRIARTRSLTPERVRELVAKHTLQQTWGALGEPRINVLQLNLDLDGKNADDSTLRQ